MEMNPHSLFLHNIALATICMKRDLQYVLFLLLGMYKLRLM